jgi:predicted TIM-barrel fold metal-dependent hydrolase
VTFDAHFHVVDPRFPLIPNQGYLPEPFTVADYRAATAGLDVTGGAVVSGSFHGTDQSHLLAALERLGPGFVGVAQLAATASDAEILALARAGVRAVRFNVRRGGELDAELALRVHALAGWHTEVQVDGRELAAVEDRLRALPRLCIDHLGMHRDGLPALLRLVERGAKVKASGFGRVELDVPQTLRAIAAVDPGALLFGTDLPGTRAPRPFEPGDLALVAECAPAARGENARAFYDLPAK